MSNLLKSTNRGIIARGHKSRNIGLRAQLLHLKVGEVLVSRDKDAKGLANSLSRTTKRTSGTRFAVSDLGNGEVEIQLVRHIERKRMTQMTLPMPEVKVEILPPPAAPVSIKLDDSDVVELNALRELFNGFMQRLEMKNGK
jgi:hypothetical protein